MAQELIYTSAPRGLQGAANGFTTVVQTRGLPATVASALERLASYRRPGGGFHDVPKFMHQVLRSKGAGKSWHVVARIAPRHEEVSGRDNFLAHFILLDEDELPEGGPAWLLQQPGFVETAWHDEVGERSAAKQVPQGAPGSRDCPTWQFLTGNGGWAHWLARAVSAAEATPVHVVYGADAAQSLLDLIAEAQALLPAAQRWRVTFTTLYDSSANLLPFLWNFVPAGSAEARKVLSQAEPHAVLDLTRPLGPPPAPMPLQPALAPLTAAPAPAVAPVPRRAPLPAEPVPIPQAVLHHPMAAQPAAAEYVAPSEPVVVGAGSRVLLWGLTCFFMLLASAGLGLAGFFYLEKRQGGIALLKEQKAFAELQDSNNELAKKHQVLEEEKRKLTTEAKAAKDGSLGHENELQRLKQQRDDLEADLAIERARVAKSAKALKDSQNASNALSEQLKTRDVEHQQAIAAIKSTTGAASYDDVCVVEVPEPQTLLLPDQQVLTRRDIERFVKFVHPASMRNDALRYRISINTLSPKKAFIIGTHPTTSNMIDVATLTRDGEDRWNLKWLPPGFDPKKGEFNDVSRIAKEVMGISLLECIEKPDKKVFLSFRDDSDKARAKWVNSHNELVWFQGAGKVKDISFDPVKKEWTIKASENDLERLLCFQVIDKIRVTLVEKEPGLARPPVKKK